MRPRIWFRFITGVCALQLLVAAATAAPVKVGTDGNEPLITVGPDGTIYISALQHLYRSTDNGSSWKELAGPIYASTLNLNSDSSISVDPGNRLYFTFDYPYAGSTAVCTSDDHGDTWTCNPAVVPGGTDRMWVVAPTNSAAYEVTNEGLYETTFLASSDRGLTWVPHGVGSGMLEPQTGPLLNNGCSKFVYQITKVSGLLQLYVYDPTSATSLISDIRPTGLQAPLALPGATFGLDQTLYAVSEEANANGGRQVVMARSTDEGQHWTKLPPIPTTLSGTATFTWVAAAEPGHAGAIFYYSPDNGDPGTMTNAKWSAVWAESRNADSDNPTWDVTTLEEDIHEGVICVAASCSGTDRFAGDFISATMDVSGAAHLTWVKQEDAAGATSIHYARIQSGAPSTFSATCAATATPTPAATATPTPSATPTASPSATARSTATPSPSPTPASTGTPTPSATATSTVTPTSTPAPSSTPTATSTPTSTPSTVRLVNISGRSDVQTGNDIPIGGFIVQGSGLKRVLVRGLGPSIRVNDQPVANALQDPVLELVDSRGGEVKNDNWRDTQEQDIEQTGLAPTDDRESAIVALLPAGNYTAILRGVNESTGIGLVEIYDLDASSDAQLGNLSVRADVLTGDNALIDGVILRGGETGRVLFRGIGPELRERGVADDLDDPTMELHDADGGLLASNDNWIAAQNADEIAATGLAPTDAREPAILMPLGPGNYTTILRGVNDTTGVALSEAYKLDQ